MKNQKRGENLFQSLCQLFGLGSEYKASVKGFIGDFTFQPLRIKDDDFCVGFQKTEHLTTVIICKEKHAFQEGPEIGTILFKVDAGRKGPTSEIDYYPDCFVIAQNNQELKSFRVFSLEDLLIRIGQMAISSRPQRAEVLKELPSILDNEKDFSSFELAFVSGTKDFKLIHHGV